VSEWSCLREEVAEEFEALADQQRGVELLTIDQVHREERHETDANRPRRQQRNLRYLRRPKAAPSATCGFGAEISLRARGSGRQKTRCARCTKVAQKIRMRRYRARVGRR
jgi:hypothetical protein